MYTARFIQSFIVMSSKRITLADVAAEAGVSIQTASHVLSRNPTVRLPDATRQKVIAAAERLGYQPNRAAQATRKGKTDVIGVWMPLGRMTIAYLRYLNLLADITKRDGYDLMISGLDRETALGPVKRLPSDWPVDGLISIDSGPAVIALRQKKTNTHPPVLIFGYEEVANSDSVVWRIREAFENATRCLIQSGARHIIHLTLDWIIRDYPNERRRTGYSKAMVENGLEPVLITSPDETITNARLAIIKYIEQHGVPDAITTFTDPMAFGAAKALVALGIPCPERCQIIGYGDYPDAAEAAIPISSIVIPAEEAVAQGWEFLKQRIENPSLESRFLELDMPLALRESTRIAPSCTHKEVDPL